MPYCRRCGAQIEENARFCHKCGTQVVNYFTPTAPIKSKPIHKDPFLLAVIGLVVILVTSLIVTVVLVVPVSPWNISESFEDKNPNVKTLNLNFDTNVGQVNVATMKIGENNVHILVKADGARGILGETDVPVTVSFDNQTVGDVLTLNSKVQLDSKFGSQAKVVVSIYLDPDLILNLNVSSTTGQVSFTGDKPTEIRYLNLETTTGTVQAHLHGNLTVAGNISLKTTTGEVHYRMSELDILENCNLNLQSTTGSVYMDFTQTRLTQGNIKVDIATTTGSINIGLKIDEVGAIIRSQVGSFGDIFAETKNFSGEKNMLQSNNYPAETNIEIDNTVSGFGDINIQANYQSDATAA